MSVCARATVCMQLTYMLANRNMQNKHTKKFSKILLLISSLNMLNAQLGVKNIVFFFSFYFASTSYLLEPCMNNNSSISHVHDFSDQCPFMFIPWHDVHERVYWILLMSIDVHVHTSLYFSLTSSTALYLILILIYLV